MISSDNRARCALFLFFSVFFQPETLDPFFICVGTVYSRWPLDEGILRSVAIDLRVRWVCFYSKADPYAVRFRASDLFFSI